MENLIFSLNATVPVFLMMILGLVFKKIGWIDDIFASKMNKFVFMVPLPVLVFEDLATVDFSKVWDVKFVLFCFIVTMISITISFLISCLLNPWRIYSGGLPKQCCSPWNRIYPKHLWKCRNGSFDDHWKCTII
jgi:predicted permease